MTELRKALERAIFDYQREAGLTEEEAAADAGGIAERFDPILAALASQSLSPTDDVRGHRHILAMMLTECPYYEGDDPRARYYQQRREAIEAALAALSAQLPPPNRGEERAKLVEYVQVQCNRYRNGYCSTLRCLRRGGWNRGDPVDYSQSTCEEHEIVLALATPSSLEGWVLDGVRECAKAIAEERRRYNEESPTWRAFGFCIDICRHVGEQLTASPSSTENKS